MRARENLLMKKEQAAVIVLTSKIHQRSTNLHRRQLGRLAAKMDRQSSDAAPAYKMLACLAMLGALLWVLMDSKNQRVRQTGSDTILESTFPSRPGDMTPPSHFTHTKLQEESQSTREGQKAPFSSAAEARLRNIDCASMHIVPPGGGSGDEALKPPSLLLAPKRLFDVFTFNNEFEMLRAHLSELGDVVDVFVLAEATTTFQGAPKPLHFNELANTPTNAQEWLRPFIPKIRHVIVDDMPACSSTSAWQCETHQRNALLRGMHDLHPDDVVIVSDVDEILKRATAERLRYCKVPLPMVTATRFHYYSLHWRKHFWWPHPNVASGAQVQGSSIEAIRQDAIYDREANTWRRVQRPVVVDSGWHLSFFMTIDDIVRKIHSFSHTEYNQPRAEPGLLAWDDTSRIVKAVCAGRDLFERDAASEDLAFIDHIVDAPHLVLQNLDRWPLFTAYGQHDPMCRPGGVVRT